MSNRRMPSRLSTVASLSRVSSDQRETHLALVGFMAYAEHWCLKDRVLVGSVRNARRRLRRAQATARTFGLDFDKLVDRGMDAIAP